MTRQKWEKRQAGATVFHSAGLFLHLCIPVKYAILPVLDDGDNGTV